MRRIGPETSWTVPGNRFEIPEYAKEAFHVLCTPPVCHVEIPGGHGNTLEHGRRHSDHDELNPLVSESIEDLVNPELYGCHVEL